MAAAGARIVNASTMQDEGRLAKTVPLTAIVIARNEAANIEACLASLEFAAERIVVENASTDDTVMLARRCGATVSSTQDWPGFGPQKNRALALATQEWVLSIDADERVSQSLALEITGILRGPAERTRDAYEIPRLTNFCGRWIRHCGWTPDHVVRLFRRGKVRFSDDLVHERVVLGPGKPGRLRSPLFHYSYRTPAHYWRKLEQYSHAWALQKRQQGERTSMARAAAAGVVAFLRSYILRLGFMDGAMGLAVCTMQAQAAFGKYFELYCLNQQTGPTDEP
jgi:glycosyltransferase involved in cell wall biosynthesis